MKNDRGIDIELVSYLASFTHDPLKFVYAAFPWGEPGPLEHMRPLPLRLMRFSCSKKKFSRKFEMVSRVHHR